MGVIFDLDQTIIDSQLALHYRNSGNWKTTYSLIPQFQVYEGIITLIEKLNVANIPLCIVTSSPSKYCNEVLNHHGIKIANKVCYHDTRLRKPYPDPMNKAISLLAVHPTSVISIGDDPKDIISSKSAGIYSVAATWGSLNKKELLESNPDAICNSVVELEDILKQKLKIN
ncbi:MAG: HAD family hydrolase [Bacteroidia bacterium]